MGDDDLGSPKKKVCVVWDEDNLITNEGIKADLNCQKIDEPDTPFVRSPLRETDSSDDEQGEGLRQPRPLLLCNLGRGGYGEG